MAYPERILVTGANGFVGKHLVPALQTAFPEANLHTRRFDITDVVEVKRIVGAFLPDALVHLAGVTAIPHAQMHPDRAWSVNLRGTLHLAQAVLSEVPSCRFLHVSSGDIYGASFRSGQPLDENALLAPLNTYAATKAAADLAIGAMVSDGLNAIRLRPFNHTGPGQPDTFVISAFAAQIARIQAGVQEPVIRVGNLKSARDFLDVRDVAAAYTRAIARADVLAPGITLNLASGTPRQIGDVLDALVAQAGMNIAIEIDSARLRPVDIPQACGDAAAARRLLGWSPTIPFETTLHDILIAA